MICDAVLVGTKVVLVPYRAEHVEKYHQWMSNPLLRELTASDPLALEEEYEMPSAWHKTSVDFIYTELTFIILVRAAGRDVSSFSMAGDVNLFLKGNPGDEDPEAEAEIMIAAPVYRRQGFAYEALRLMLSYVTASSADFGQFESLEDNPPPPSPIAIKPTCLVVRISQSNTPSISLFERLGFSVVKVVGV
ncbi:hypothetical protein BV22DRAFT_1022500 [Leucogyrophana mollusca]|uniref:Uncharacterized protein n=1 Tax=Leucogyrophana mollusca TaxID=85980 RepID=A0ACB8B3H3_9AGAM|nr:hypothetical protein BV22DRAFT_1022500 [Leucogyrophana mollusca]